jgi:hypothetical protein
MNRYAQYVVAAAIAGLGAVAYPPHAVADFELTAPDGRRILLKDDNTWRYLDSKDAKAAPGAASKEAVAKADAAKDGKDKGAKDADKTAEKPKDQGEAVLYLDGKVDGNRICRYQLRLTNNLPYEIRSLVPEFSVYRGNGVMYDSVFMGFSFLRPGDTQQREIRFDGINCQDVARVKVGGGDRCEMGELDKFSAVKGKCLSLVRVVASEVVRFDK